MTGCLKGIVKLVVLAVLVAGLVVGFIYRREVWGTVSRWFGARPTALPPVAEPQIGAPTEAALASGRAKLADLARPRGPDSVVLTANETASLVGSGLDWSVRRSFDSLRVELGPDRIVVHARLHTDRLPKDALGPVGGAVDPVEPIRVGGTLSVTAPGVADWTVDEFQLGSFPFPKPVIARLVPRLGGNRDGSFPLTIPPPVGRMRVTPRGLVVFRLVPAGALTR